MRSGRAWQNNHIENGGHGQPTVAAGAAAIEWVASFQENRRSQNVIATEGIRIMKILIVHAHPEAKSFSSALANTAKNAFTAEGHEVVMSDLYRMRFNPVSDRTNFTTVKDPEYYKQQVEEAYASDNDGFAPNIETEIQKLEAADALIFSFPIWWFGMPAILKGWCDRVLVYKRVYGGPLLFENGIGKNSKPGLILMTTGAPENAYNGHGFDPPMEKIMTPIQYGVFWFNGFTPLEPFIAYAPAQASEAERAVVLEKLSGRITGLFDEAPLRLPYLADFPDFGPDSKQRYMVEVQLKGPVDEGFREKIPAEVARLAEHKRDGKLLCFFRHSHEDWRQVRIYLEYRAADGTQLQAFLEELPLYDRLDFRVRELDRTKL
ncbi:MAG: NAD(P)H-dependent oxidoreductase [Desulfosarcinaceae bacterium]|nr:NAD(P)H-dependent oxidoreductase [Desulfosarcinaceae bacterium]